MKVGSKGARFRIVSESLTFDRLRTSMECFRKRLVADIGN